jgi:hypothetical protein
MYAMERRHGTKPWKYAMEVHNVGLCSAEQSEATQSRSNLPRHPGPPIRHDVAFQTAQPVQLCNLRNLSVDTPLLFTLRFISELMHTTRFTFGFFAYRVFTARLGKMVCDVPL